MNINKLLNSRYRITLFVNSQHERRQLILLAKSLNLKTLKGRGQAEFLSSLIPFGTDNFFAFKLFLEYCLSLDILEEDEISDVALEVYPDVLKTNKFKEQNRIVKRKKERKKLRRATRRAKRQGAGEISTGHRVYPVTKRWRKAFRASTRTLSNLAQRRALRVIPARKVRLSYHRLFAKKLRHILKFRRGKFLRSNKSRRNLADLNRQVRLCTFDKIRHQTSFSYLNRTVLAALAPLNFRNNTHLIQVVSLTIMRNVVDFSEEEDNIEKIFNFEGAMIKSDLEWKNTLPLTDILITRLHIYEFIFFNLQTLINNKHLMHKFLFNEHT